MSKRKHYSAHCTLVIMSDGSTYRKVSSIRRKVIKLGTDPRSHYKYINFQERSNTNL